MNDQIGNTPIWIRGNDEEGYFATLADYKITELNKSYEEINEEIRMPDIEMIMRLITVMIECNENFKKIHPDVYTTKE